MSSRNSKDFYRKSNKDYKLSTFISDHNKSMNPFKESNDELHLKINQSTIHPIEVPLVRTKQITYISPHHLTQT